MTVQAKTGHVYEPPAAMHWDGDVLVLTLRKDPSSIHVRLFPSDLAPRRVYIAEVETMGECHVECFDDGMDEGLDGEWFAYATATWHLSCGHEVYGSERPCYCPTCGKRVVEP